jgi:hypothetical protein
LTKKPKLGKRDSTISLLSSCSVESDWSDEELEELEKMFGTIQHKSSIAEAQTLVSSSATAAVGEVLEHSQNRWRQLKRSRRLAMAKLQQQKSLKRLSSSISNSSVATSSRELTFHFIGWSRAIDRAEQSRATLLF